MYICELCMYVCTYTYTYIIGCVCIYIYAYVYKTYTSVVMRKLWFWWESSRSVLGPGQRIRKPRE